MSAVPEIHVTVDLEGNVTVSTRGYPGKACLEASRFLEEALGVTSTRSVTPEYYALVVANPQRVTR